MYEIFFSGSHYSFPVAQGQETPRAYSKTSHFFFLSFLAAAVGGDNAVAVKSKIVVQFFRVIYSIYSYYKILAYSLCQFSTSQLVYFLCHVCAFTLT